MKSLPQFSVENPVLVGVLMAAILVGGVYSGLTLVREMFPESRPNKVVITTPYPGATPLEIEKGLSIKIEEAIKNIEHIEKIETTITEGLSAITVSMTSDAKDLDQVVNDFKAEIDAIPQDELPEEAEETRVVEFEPSLPVISVSLYGDVDEQTLKDAGRDLRDDLTLILPQGEVTLEGARKAELSVEVQPEKMTAYRLSLTRIARAIRESNLDLPAGQLKTPQHNVAVRTLMETDEAAQIEQTILRTRTNGEVVRVADIGRVIDGFEDSDLRSRFNGKPAVSIRVSKVGDADALEIASKVKAFTAGKRRLPLQTDWLTDLKNVFGVQTETQNIYQQACDNPLPYDLNVMLHTDLSEFIESRLDLVKRNGLWGLSFVFIALLTFLNWRVAFWVMMGLIISVCGSVILMNAVGESLNLISMFGLIVVLGLIVDDAIVVGENIYAHVESGTPPKLAAVRGAEEVTWPVIIAVITTIAAFMPLLFIEGQMGDFMGVLPIVVTCALAVSLIEALSILPSHLADWLRPVKQVEKQGTRSTPGASWIGRRFHRLEGTRQRFVQHLIDHYEKLLRLAVRYRYVTVASIAALLIISLGLFAGERVPFVYIQKMDTEIITTRIDMPIGTPVERTEEAIKVLEEKALKLPEVRNISTLVGSALTIGEIGATSTGGSHLAQAIIELSTLEERDRSSEAIIADLREATNNITGVNSIKYSSMQGGPGGAPIEIEITGDRQEDILVAANRLQDKLKSFAGVYDIADDFEKGRREVQVELRDSARPLGITAEYLATEVRGAFYGLEARTLQRGKEDVDIRVRFPEERRKNVYELEGMRIVTPDGRRVPFHEVARMEEGEGYASIRRVDQRRAVVVSADVDQSQANAEQIIASLSEPISTLENELAGLRIDFAGNKRETSRSLGSLKRDFLIALLLIFVLLAGLFKSYFQPLIVLTAVPFGLNGAVFGHLIMGYPLTLLSMIGIVALTGIVVNDALILVNFVNKDVAGGKPVFEAVIAGGRRRLRPILLTSLTTILGLAPIMAETSFQARFLIPMAVSISFGLAFGTVLTLIVVPSIYMIVEDFHWLVCRIWYGEAPQASHAVQMHANGGESIQSE